MNSKRQAAAFRKKYNLKNINSSTLCETLGLQGYTVIEFNGIRDKKSVSDLIEVLHLGDQVSYSRCFTYRDNKYRLVFLHEDLNEEERIVALAHEEGHIWNRHMNRQSVIGEDVIEEFDANEFAHYLLSDSDGQKHRSILFALFFIIAVLILTISILFAVKKHSSAIYSENLYRTVNGTKYHLRNCMYIIDRTDVYRLTYEEFDSGIYEPCHACLPDQR
ncbi:MAG: ImmA/IrrE family metallo-endopeptidase [Oscillospiraceae bacterium]|nr:ImmA/IrrE family metallo-endopeptidase [Oscillospiraceae bacterium]